MSLNSQSQSAMRSHPIHIGGRWKDDREIYEGAKKYIR